MLKQANEKNSKILLVDDDQTILDILKPGLEQAEFDVLTASNAETAIDCYENHYPDICVIDFSLPDHDGTELVKKLRQIRYRPVIMLSSHDEIEIVDKAIETGASHYLVKPLSAKQLLPTIRLSLTQFEDSNQQLSSHYHDNPAINLADEILNQFAFGILVIDQQCNCINMNKIASELINGDSLVKMMNGKIYLDQTIRQSEFSQYISQLFTTNPISYNPVFSVEKELPGQWCHFYATKLGSNTNGQQALLMVIDSGQDQPLTADILNSLYGLTPKESALAEAINSGIKLEDYALNNKIKITTVKTHLNAIFRKTGTNRQVDLVRLLSRIFDVVKF